MRVLALGVVLIACARQATAQCEATDHGMRADGSDNVAALTKVLAECAGQRIYFAHGRYVFSPKGFAPGIKIPSGTALAGEGSQGPRAGGIRFEGTPYESGCTRHLDYGHAIYVQSDSGQSAGIDSVDISNNFFHNFNGQSWVTVNAADGSPGVGLNGRITIKNNVFDSDAQLVGGCAATGGMSYPVAMVWLHGSDESGRA
jgi:hypothetical protein